MAKVALVSHDVQTIDGRGGGVGAFVTHFGRLLREAGDQVTIVLTRQETHPVRVDDAWRRKYAEWGIELVELHSVERTADRWVDTWSVRLSEQVAPLLDGFDIAYFQDWANVAFHIARQKRFGRASAPLLVTVLHGPSGWIGVGNRRYPEVPEGLHLDYAERYAARHSDMVVSPSRYMLEWARRNGWEMPGEPAVLGLPYIDSAWPEDAVPGSPIRKLIFFGRLETRKGASLFVAALRLLFRENASALRNLTEIVLLGGEQAPGMAAQTRLELAELGVPVRHEGGLDSAAAGQFLAANAGDSLAVVASPVENFPYAVIEASRIPGLRTIASRGGGIPEIFDGRGDGQLFDPHPAALARKLAEILTATPSAVGLRYDADAANARWLAFHRTALAKQAAPQPVRVREARTVDVCIPNYNSSKYLAQLLQGLERQTVQGFGVIAVDDGSCPAQRAEFEALAAQYQERGWKFVTQDNAFVDAARNRASSLSDATYLLFLDADDFPAPHTIQRMLEAIELSGDDCLVTGGLLFEGDESPYDFDTHAMAAQPRANYMPLGPDLVNGLVDPNVLGPPMVLVRRSAFQAIGGYHEIRGAAHEDWELQIGLTMAGYRVDVLPEYLLYFRRREDGLSHISADYEAKRRLIETYEDALGKVGLRGLATSLIALLKRQQELEASVLEVRDARTARLHGLVTEMLRRKAQS